MKNKFLLLLLAIVGLSSCKNEHDDLPDGLYAELTTNQGTILLELNYQKAPVTVANFVSLAEGNNNFVREELKGRPFFNGLRWHRVIKDFMIQTGDPDGTGSGDTGYKFQDEITDLKHDKPGILSMANSGPGTNSSQFFITHVPTPWLDGRHTVFGQVIGDGMETVNKINQDDQLESVTIIRKGENAKKFDAVKIFNDYFSKAEENLRKQAAEAVEQKLIYEQKFSDRINAKAAQFNEIKTLAVKTSSGLQYKIVEKGSGKKPQAGKPVFLYYSAYLESGEMLDSNVESVAKELGKFQQERLDGGGYEPIPFQFGRKSGMIPGFIEGIEAMSFGDKAVLFIPSYLGYGEQGAGNGVIPPNANLIMEVQLIEKPVGVQY